MSKEFIDGGPAFPFGQISETTGQPVNGFYNPGMSLRDAFAISVAGHIWGRYQRDGTAQEYDNWREGVAIEAYRLADEMLAERENKS